ncbi:MAG: hypothetical protein U0324_33665 [Polyangiales bacterium]
MIDRGALVLAPTEGTPYAGLRRKPLDGLAWTGRKGKDLARSYAQRIVEGDGVLDDLDDAIALRDAARAMGFADVDVVVFAVPQTPWNPKALPVAEDPPAEDLEFLGWDVVEPMEPWDSPLAKAGHGEAVNARGLLADRSAAERLAARVEAETPGDEPWVAVRVWRVRG